VNFSHFATTLPNSDGKMNLARAKKRMAGLKGKSGPPGNTNAFKHGLATIQKRREESITTEHEESVRQQIVDGLIADKGGDEQNIDGHQDYVS
jgi:hypothetical protein